MCTTRCTHLPPVTTGPPSEKRAAGGHIGSLRRVAADLDYAAQGPRAGSDRGDIELIVVAVGDAGGDAQPGLAFFVSSRKPSPSSGRRPISVLARDPPVPPSSPQQVVPQGPALRQTERRKVHHRGASRRSDQNQGQPAHAAAELPCQVELEEAPHQVADHCN
eukprot:CAMPEP_0195054262 /NCGR_PEP_ID=MMETSP0448-20130528/3227_1 /TAXON_ID=66468 /ORGANISM="Heterocapsa triquestra, Strain CCMP 448" /LENGTH=162 /DNA_ID=CAMNT_0040083733 /DNA_START=59 /DNA_END=549 /DNA_ORIENTATION=+